MLLSSKYGKLYQAKYLVSLLQLTGDEKILDVGYGKGLLLIETARQLSTGKALGIDIWNQQDLSYNTKSATIDNATIEGVKDRIEVVNADVRSLPFADQSFDAVISSMVIHNIANQVERKKAIEKMIRVLKPKRTLIIQEPGQGQYRCQRNIKESVFQETSPDRLIE